MSPELRTDAANADPPIGKRRAALAFIFITLVLDMLALGMIVPVLPKLVEGLVFSPILGALSDRYGRRPVVLLSNFGLGLDYIVMAIVRVSGGCWWDV